MESARAYRRAGKLTLAGLLLVWPLSGIGQEQEAPGRPSLKFTLSERLGWKEGDDLNREEEGLTATTGLGIVFDTATPVSSLNFTLDGGLRNNLSNGSSDLRDPRLQLTYGRENRSTALDLDLSYRRDDVDTRALDDDLETDVVRFGTGTREDIRTDLGFVFGRDDPFGGSLDLSYSASLYSDTDDDPSLQDRERYFTRGQLNFEITPRIDALLRATYSDTDRAGTGRDVRQTNLSAGATFTVNETLTTTALLGHTRTTERVRGVTTRTGGPSLRLSFEQERPNGTWTGSLNSDLNDTGRRRGAVRLNRSLDLPRGTIRAGAGLSQSEDFDLQPLYSLAYTHERPRSDIDVSFEQSFTTDDDGDEALNSRLNASYRQQLTALASLQAGFVLRTTDYLGNTDDDDSLMTFNLAYRHNLAEDWALVSGYRHEVDNDNDSIDRTDEIFLTIEKSFWRRF